MYILPSYAISAAGLIGLTLWTVIGWYKARAVLAKLEQK